MEPIANLSSYTERMRKSMEDKLWFLDKMSPSIVNLYDYGCADGTLLKLAKERCTRLSLYGFDINRDMLKLAKCNVPDGCFMANPSVEVPPHTLLNASSVFHEIHSYSEDATQDYEHIFGCGAELIAIRDMFYSEKSIHGINPALRTKIYKTEPSQKISSFEKFHGSLEDDKNLLHYLLKYRYVDNWEREVRENYLPHSIEEFLAKIPKSYEMVFYDSYTLPFIRDKIYADFGADLRTVTHGKILLKMV